MTQDEYNRRNTIQLEALAFRIWREGNPVGWRCTARELAEAVKLPIQTVRKICRARGWPIQQDYEGSLAGGHIGATRQWNPPADTFMARLV